MDNKPEEETSLKPSNLFKISGKGNLTFVWFLTLKLINMADLRGVTFRLLIFIHKSNAFWEKIINSVAPQCDSESRTLLLPAVKFRTR